RSSRTACGRSPISSAASCRHDADRSRAAGGRGARKPSERQWHDVLGILRLRERELDHAYLHDWSTALGVDDLLARAEREVLESGSWSPPGTSSGRAGFRAHGEPKPAAMHP